MSSPGWNTGSRFSAETALDVSDLMRGVDAGDQLVAEVVVRLLAACRAERLVDDSTRLQLLRPVDDGWLVASVDHAVRQSALGIHTALSTASSQAPAGGSGTLSVVLPGGGSVRAQGAWGLTGLGVATLSAAAPVIVPWSDAAATGLSLVPRHIATLGLAVEDSPQGARAVVRALQAVELSMRPAPGVGARGSFD